MDTSKPVTPEMVLAGDVSRMQTRHMLVLFRRWRRSHGYYARLRWEYMLTESQTAYMNLLDAATEKLRLALTERGHVLNKADGKAARREAAKRKR